MLELFKKFPYAKAVTSADSEYDYYSEGNIFSLPTQILRSLL